MYMDRFKRLWAAEAGSGDGSTGHDKDCDCQDAGCDCETDQCDCGEDSCGCGHDHSLDSDDFNLADLFADMSEEELADRTVTMIDEETNESHRFVIADDFDFEDEVYAVLVSTGDDPEIMIARVVTLDDDSEGFETLDDETFARVSAEYDRICEESFSEADDLDDESEDDQE
ncbi:DUF1292 domain-containing protein [Oscillospiraceae bacterium HV4-5-C5C]|nr:DUF1292 domain-containing protein [Oscillospiraceae bacterium HV4-5-C5C]